MRSDYRANTWCFIACAVLSDSRCPGWWDRHLCPLDDRSEGGSVSERLLVQSWALLLELQWDDLPGERQMPSMEKLGRAHRRQQWRPFRLHHELPDVCVLGVAFLLPGCVFSQGLCPVCLWLWNTWGKLKNLSTCIIFNIRISHVNITVFVWPSRSRPSWVGLSSGATWVNGLLWLKPSP